MALAPGLPTFNIHFSHDGSIDVVEGDAIPTGNHELAGGKEKEPNKQAERKVAKRAEQLVARRHSYLLRIHTWGRRPDNVMDDATRHADHNTTPHLIHQVRYLAPHAHVLVRCRYHVRHWELLNAGRMKLWTRTTRLGKDSLSESATSSLPIRRKRRKTLSLGKVGDREGPVQIETFRQRVQHGFQGLTTIVDGRVTMNAAEQGTQQSESLFWRGEFNEPFTVYL